MSRGRHARRGNGDWVAPTVAVASLLLLGGLAYTVWSGWGIW